MTVRNGGRPANMLAGLFLYVPGLIFERVTSSFAARLGKVTGLLRGNWRSQRAQGVNAFPTQRQPISKSAAAQQYKSGYETGALIAGYRSLPELHAALRLFAPMAKSEFDWGAVDALIDEIQKRNGQKPFL